MNIDLKEYRHISRILFWSIGLNIFIVLALHYHPFDDFITQDFGFITRLAIEQFFYGALAATIACSIFLSKDKEINELENVKSKPDPKELRLPDIIDKRLYIQRILSSGLLAVFGMFIILLVFNYLEITTTKDFTFKQKLLIGVFSFMVGLYQSKFLSYIEKLFDNFAKSKISGRE